MAVTKYTKKDSNGRERVFYRASAEAINIYTGRRHQKARQGIKSKALAERLFKELWSICRNEKPGIKKPKNWLCLKIIYLESLEAQVRNKDKTYGISPNTFLNKKGLLARTKHWDDMHPDLVTPQFVQNQLQALLDSESISYTLYQRLFSEIKDVFQLAAEMGIYNYNVFVDVKLKYKKPKKKKVALTHEEANFFLAEARKRNHPYFFVWAMALSTGMRRSELAGLKWTDIDFENGLIYVQRQKIPGEGIVHKTKGGEDRTVALPQFMISLIKQEMMKSSSEFVIKIHCDRWKKGNQAAVTRKFCREIGIKEITFHQLRATYITLAIVDNISLGIIKESVGHSKLSTTDIYFRSSGVNLKGQTDGLKLKIPIDEEAQILDFK